LRAAAAPHPEDGPDAAPAARKPRLLEFEMPGCSACKAMAPVMRALEKNCAHGLDVVRHVDVIAPDGEALASRYGVRVLPTFVAVDAEGAEVVRLSGVQEPARIAAVLTEITGDGCRID
jgi:thioredoxin-like negative regulator of GroEL